MRRVSDPRQSENDLTPTVPTVERIPGDSKGDGDFNSSDLVRVFQIGKYEDGIPGNATFGVGDWNRDGDFNSSDLLFAFQAGHYETAARLLPAEIAAAVEAALAESDRERVKAFIAVGLAPPRRTQCDQSQFSSRVRGPLECILSSMM